MAYLPQYFHCNCEDNIAEYEGCSLALVRYRQHQLQAHLQACPCLQTICNMTELLESLLAYAAQYASFSFDAVQSILTWLHVCDAVFMVHPYTITQWILAEASWQSAAACSRAADSGCSTTQ